MLSSWSAPFFDGTVGNIVLWAVIIVWLLWARYQGFGRY